MDARHTNFLKFIRGVNQFEVPIYQRKYSWDRIHCEQLWDDIIRAGKGDLAGGHFIGTIVYVADSEAHDSPLLIIDGQQRVTTLSLLIVAISEALEGQEKEPHVGFSQEKLRSYFLINPLESGKKYRKLVLSEVDCETLFAIVDNRDLPENHSIRIQENFKYFRERISEFADDLNVICKGLSNLHIVYVALTRSEDREICPL